MVCKCCASCVGLGEGNFLGRCHGDREVVVGFQTWHLDIIHVWVRETDNHLAVILFPGAETRNQLFVIADLRNPKDLALELEEVVALDIDGHDVLINAALSGNRLDMPGAEPRADVAMVAGAGTQHEGQDKHIDYCSQRPLAPSNLRGGI